MIREEVLRPGWFALHEGSSRMFLTVITEGARDKVLDELAAAARFLEVRAAIPSVQALLQSQEDKRPVLVENAAVAAKAGQGAKLALTKTLKKYADDLRRARKRGGHVPQAVLDAERAERKARQRAGAVASQVVNHDKVTERIRATVAMLEAERKPVLELLPDVLRLLMS